MLLLSILYVRLAAVLRVSQGGNVIVGVPSLTSTSSIHMRHVQEVRQLCNKNYQKTHRKSKQQPSNLASPKFSSKTENFIGFLIEIPKRWRIGSAQSCMATGGGAEVAATASLGSVAGPSPVSWICEQGVAVDAV